MVAVGGEPWGFPGPSPLNAERFSPIRGAGAGAAIRLIADAHWLRGAVELSARPVVVGPDRRGPCSPNRLSADPGAEVLLVEAGGRPNPLIAMAAVRRTHRRSRRSRGAADRPSGRRKGRVLVRGRHSTGRAVNGMVYDRGQATDSSRCGARVGLGRDRARVRADQDNGCECRPPSGVPTRARGRDTSGTRGSVAGHERLSRDRRRAHRVRDGDDPEGRRGTGRCVPAPGDRRPSLPWFRHGRRQVAGGRPRGRRSRRGGCRRSAARG